MATREDRGHEVRVPPQDIEAEISVLGSLMLDHEAIFRVADALAVHDFYKPVHREIYEAIMDLFARREPVDVMTVTSRLREKNKIEEIGGSAYLATLVNSVPTASHIEHYATLVRRKRLLRDLIGASHHIAQLGYKEADNIEELIDEAEQKIFGIAKDSLKQEFFPIKEGLADALERIDRLHKGDGALRGVSTGFADLDGYLAGLQKSDLIILAARPSLGKTSLALNIARNVAAEEKRAVGVFSLEMSREQVVDRLIASEASVDLWRLRTGKLRADGPDNDFARLRDAMDALSETPIFIDDSASPTVMELRAKARRLQAQHDVGLIVVDYLQLIRGHGNTDSRVQEVSEISRSLKGLAKELNVPVLALSQLSRGIEMRGPSAKPKLSDLRESGCLAGDTLIMRADTGEMISIKNLVGQKEIPIFSLNENLQLEVRHISKVFSSGYKRLFALKTRSGRIIKASANHPFRTIHGWQRLDELAVRTAIALPRTYAPTRPHSSFTNDEAILLAHLIGDGCVLPRQPIHYTSADQSNIAIVCETAQRLFGITPRVVRQKNWFHVYLPSPYRLTHGKHHPITDWFSRLGLEPVRSYGKKLPQTLFQSDTEKIRLFLHHLWATDGNLSWKRLKGRKPAAAIYYATTSGVLAMQVQHLLLRLGIMSTARIVPQKKGERTYRSLYNVFVEGSVSQLRFCELVGSYGSRGKDIPAVIVALKAIMPNPNADVIPKEVWRTCIAEEKNAEGIGWREFSQRINTAYCGSTLFKSGLTRMRMTRVAEALQSASLLQIAQSDVYWDEIISITPLGMEEVFDATVPGTHNFIANDFIVHNSIEQDADVVMFIYREDKVKENSDRKNIAEILIEKHRNGPTGKIELYFNEQSVAFRSIEKHRDTFETL